MNTLGTHSVSANLCGDSFARMSFHSCLSVFIRGCRWDHFTNEPAPRRTKDTERGAPSPQRFARACDHALRWAAVRSLRLAVVSMGEETKLAGACGALTRGVGGVVGIAQHCGIGCFSTPWGTPRSRRWASDVVWGLGFARRRKSVRPCWFQPRLHRLVPCEISRQRELLDHHGHGQCGGWSRDERELLRRRQHGRGRWPFYQRLAFARDEAWLYRPAL